MERGNNGIALVKVNDDGLDEWIDIVRRKYKGLEVVGMECLKIEEGMDEVAEGYVFGNEEWQWVGSKGGNVTCKECETLTKDVRGNWMEMFPY